MPKIREGTTRIKVVGVGGGGHQAIRYMANENLPDVEFVSVYSDYSSSMRSNATTHIQIEDNLADGRRTRRRSMIIRKSAEKSWDVLHNALDGADVVFIVAGLGGGTGTGASPVVAQVSKELGALTIGVITRPFTFEGAVRLQVAHTGLADLGKQVDSLIVIPNDGLLQIFEKRKSVVQAFSLADEALCRGVQCISTLMTPSALVDLDFAAIRETLSVSGTALMTIAYADDNDIDKAVEAAINDKKIRSVIDEAKGIIINIAGGSHLNTSSLEATRAIMHNHLPDRVPVLLGGRIDENMMDRVRVTIIAAGID